MSTACWVAWSQKETGALEATMDARASSMIERAARSATPLMNSPALSLWRVPTMRVGPTARLFACAVNAEMKARMCAGSSDF
eukprot:3424755-Pleurochrysis_carterae.AAC.1